MKCEEISVLLVDDRARRNPEVGAHVRSCRECRGLLATDAWARELGRLDAVPALAAPDGWRDFSRRRRGRFTLAVAGLVGVGALGAVAAGGGFTRGRPPLASGTPLAPIVQRHDAPIAAASETEPLRVTGEPRAGSGAAGDGSLIDDLVVETSAYVRRDVTVRDVTYAPFGDLPRWVSLPRNRSLEAPVFQRALYPLHSNLEITR
jgi:hypothetical protein